jgi:periplasmic divalent cation tolerance protein
VSDYLQVTTTADNRDTAASLARSAVAARLAGAAFVSGPNTSFFWHNGELGEGQEWQVTLRTTAERYKDLEAHLLEVHPWDNPELTAVPIVKAPDAYKAWLDKSVNEQ